MRGQIAALVRCVWLGCAIAPTAAAGDEPLAATSAKFRLSAEEQQKIAAALPSQAAAVPKKPRKLLIFCRNVGYGGHPSIAHANLALALAGRKTGAFEAVVNDDPEVFRPASLRQFDAVFFNNTVGNLFTDPALRQSLADFVYGGGGLMGTHGATVAFTVWPGAKEDWPEFGRMLGGRGARHRENTELVSVRLDDPGHPLTRVFGGPFSYRDEFFRVSDPYSRERNRVLLSIDVTKTDLDRAPYRGRRERGDDDYALAWVRNYGRGRVFYSTIAHHPQVFWDPTMVAFYLAAAQFVLGDLEAPTLASAKLTPAARAQEKLGWRLAATAYTFHKFTLFETIEKTAELGLSHLEGLSFQKVGGAIPKNLDPSLSGEELRQVRAKLDAAGVRMLTYYYHRLPGDEVQCRKLFEFGRQLGIEAFLSEPDPADLDLIERMCNEYQIDLAIHNHDAKGSPHFWKPELIARLCAGRGPRVGACGDLGYWMRAGIDPVDAARTLGQRLLTVQVHDLDARGPEGADVPWGTGAGATERFFSELKALGLRPKAIGLEYSRNWLSSMPEVRACVEFFDRTTRRLAEPRSATNGK